MLNVMLLSAGVTTGWHLVQTAQQEFGSEICLHLCDINPRELVPAAALVENYHCVLPVSDTGYKQQILDLLKENHIDVIMPLMDQDLFTWAADAPELAALGVRSTAPLRKTAETLSDKKAMAAFLTAHGLPTPALVTPDTMKKGCAYIEKREVGCGSVGMRTVIGGTGYTPAAGSILQEKCDGGDTEITAEIFNAQGKLRVFCRERIATKSGVCTKMRPLDVPEIEAYIRTLTSLLPCPAAFCAQFMQHRGQWNLIDCNLRIGAGTAMASAAGFHLVRAFWANLCGQSVPDEWLHPDPSVKTVLRVYQEVVIQ